MLAAAANTPRLILIVDDNVDAASSLANLLKALGHEVRIAYDGTSAVDMAIEQHPDIVLLDIGLPGLDGYQVAARLRQDEIMKRALIIAISGYGRTHDRRRSREAGIDHHLVKPIDHNTLLTLMSAAPATC